MALTNDDRLILLGLKEAPIATFKIGSPVTSDVIAKLYSNGLLEFEGSGDIVKFSNYSTPWHNYKSNITSISFKEGNTIQPTSTAYLFQNLNKVTSIDLSNLDTSNVTNMSKMFSSCNSLNIITGLENLDTSNVTDVSMMFEYCSSLTTLDLSLFDMSEVTTTDYMFMGCSNLSSSITIGSLNITSYSGMFAGCSTEPGSEFVVKYIDNDTKSIAEAMVATKYPENSNVVLYVKSAYLINGDDFSIAAMSLTDNISSIQFSNEPPIDPTPGDILIVSESTSPIKAYMAQLATGGIIVYPEEAGSPLVANESCAAMFNFMPTSISFDNFDTSKVTDMNSMFQNCDGLTSLDLSNFDTSNVDNMSSMFSECFSLDTITGLENLNTSKVTDMSYMFNYCGALNSLDLSNWNTSKVTDMSYMFNYCVSLNSLDLSNWNTSKVTDMEYMFNSCLSLDTITGLENLNTSNVTNMEGMFSYINLEILNLSNFDTSKVTDMEYMFSGCIKLNSLDLSSFDTSNVTNMSYMFSECSSLESIYVKDLWDISNVIYGKNMFSECTYIVGESGITYNSAKIDKSMANVDTGYLSEKIKKITNIDTQGFLVSELNNDETIVTLNWPSNNQFNHSNIIYINLKNNLIIDKKYKLIVEILNGATFYSGMSGNSVGSGIGSWDITENIYTLSFTAESSTNQLTLFYENKFSNGFYIVKPSEITTSLDVARISIEVL